MQRVSRLGSLSPSVVLTSISQKLDSQVPPGSIRGSTFTLLTAIVGAGILSLPFAFRQAGLLCGLVLVVACAVISWFSIHLLIRSTSASGEMSYQGLGDFCGGRRLRVFTQVCLLLNLFGTTVAYTIASGKLLSSGIRAVYDDVSVYTGPKFIACACFVVATLPLSSMRQVSSLRYSSLLAIICSCYLAVVLVVEYFVQCTRGDIVGFWHGVPWANLLPSSASEVRPPRVGPRGRGDTGIPPAGLALTPSCCPPTRPRLSFSAPSPSSCTRTRATPTCSPSTSSSSGPLSGASTASSPPLRSSP